MFSKGIIHPLEAAEAVARGVDGVVVSNHGGRQLDGDVRLSTHFPAVVAAVDGGIPVLSMEALTRRRCRAGASLGAAACLIGRPQLWGLPAVRVRPALPMCWHVTAEIDLTMGLMGASRLGDLGQHCLGRARERVQLIGKFSINQLHRRASLLGAGAAVDHWTLLDELSQVDVAITKASPQQGKSVGSPIYQTETFRGRTTSEWTVLV